MKLFSCAALLLFTLNLTVYAGNYNLPVMLELLIDQLHSSDAIVSHLVALMRVDFDKFKSRIDRLHALQVFTNEPDQEVIKRQERIVTACRLIERRFAKEGRFVSLVSVVEQTLKCGYYMPPVLKSPSYPPASLILSRTVEYIRIMTDECPESLKRLDANTWVTTIVYFFRGLFGGLTLMAEVAKSTEVELEYIRLEYVRLFNRIVEFVQCNCKPFNLLIDSRIIDTAHPVKMQQSNNTGMMTSSKWPIRMFKELSLSNMGDYRSVISSFTIPQKLATQMPDIKVRMKKYRKIDARTLIEGGRFRVPKPILMIPEKLQKTHPSFSQLRLLQWTHIFHDTSMNVMRYTFEAGLMKTSAELLSTRNLPVGHLYCDSTWEATLFGILEPFEVPLFMRNSITERLMISGLLSVTHSTVTYFIELLSSDQVYIFPDFGNINGDAVCFVKMALAEMAFFRDRGLEKLYYTSKEHLSRIFGVSRLFRIIDDQMSDDIIKQAKCQYGLALFDNPLDDN